MISVSATVAMAVSVSLMAIDPNTADSGSSERPQVTATASDDSSGKWIESFDDAKNLSIEKRIPIVLHFEAVW